jgi:hypothetical protein
VAFLSIKSTTQVSVSEDSSNVANSSNLQLSVTGILCSGELRTTVVVPALSSVSVFNGTKTVSYTNSSNVSISTPLASEPYKFRLSSDGGTLFTFKTPKPTSVTALTSVSLQRQGQSPYMTLTATGPFTTTGISSGDLLIFEKTTDSFTSPFDLSVTHAPFEITDVTSTSLTVRDVRGISDQLSVVLNSPLALKVVANDGAVPGDKMSLSSPFFVANQGIYTVSAVSDTYVEFTSETAVPQALTLSTGSLSVYANKFDYVTAASESKFSLVFSNSTIDIVQVGQIASFSASVENPSLSIKNTNSYAIEVKLLTCATRKDVC